MEKVIVLGYGYVGKAFVDMLKGHYDIFVYDPGYKGPCEGFNLIDKIEGDYVLGVVCVPTPKGENGECDISLVEDSVSKLQTPVILVKSTIEIGTTDKLKERYGKRVVFSPEYIGESKYWQPYFQRDMREVPMLILGGDRRDTNYVIDLLAPILGPVKHYYQTTSKVAELTKYMENSFYALKVIFCNEIFEICEKSGIDYWDAREAWLLDPRLNPMHTCVFRNNRGFGGKCFPKDVSALVNFSQKLGYEPDLLKEVLRSNAKFRRGNSECL